MSTASAARQVLRPEHLAPIRSLSLRARLIVEGMIAGLHRSPYHGFSAEFSEYRAYRPGESARQIDWRKYARTERSVVRLYTDETNLQARILLDTSASMSFVRGGAMSKYEYGRTLAASLAWILIRQRDAVGLATFDERLRTVIAPRSTNVQLKAILGALHAMTPAQGTCCGRAIDELARTIGKRGLCVVISDFFDDPQAVIQGLRHLRFKRQDVMALWMLDPFEQTFDVDATLQLRDVESGVSLQLDGVTAGRYYREGFDRHRQAVGAAMRELQIDCAVVTTDEPFEKTLRRILEKRRRLP